MIDPSNEKLIGLAKAADHPLMRNHSADKPVFYSTMLRRITDGVRAADKTVIKLEAIRLPDQYYVTERTINEFIEKLNFHSRIKLLKAKTPTPKRAARELVKAGIAD